MRYAQYNNTRIEPQKGIKGAVCPVCSSPVIPKCGEIKMHHWAHKSKENCDHWWESETEWHRKWKDCFPSDWQEFIMHDETTGEKHVADVRSEHGLFVEFQHSSIKEEERISREKFYKNMVWVIDAGADYYNFKYHIRNLEHIGVTKEHFHVKIFYECFPKKWLNSSVPVVFDFGIHDKNCKEARWLWCVFPEKYNGNTLCGFCMKKETFLDRILNHKEFFSNTIIEELRREERKREEQRRIQYIEEEPWRKAMQKLKVSIEQNDFDPIWLSLKGEKIIDKKSRIYNGCKCMILCIDSYLNKWEKRQYDVLVLIECKQGIVPAIVSAVPSKFIDNLYICGAYYDYKFLNIKTTEYYDRYRANFDTENAKESVITEEVKENLRYIHDAFSRY